MAITKAVWLVQPRINGVPGILGGTGAPAAEVYDKGTIYNREDAVGQYVSDGAGTWTQLLDSASAIGTSGATAQASTAAGADTGSSGTAASGATAPAFTGIPQTQAENIAFPAFSGTGQASAGQVITTTDNQTMTLNQCAGMWFVSATHGPYLIASNTAVAGAPAVLTVYGGAPTTDAGTYKILSGVTPFGTVASHTHTGPAHTHTAGAITVTNPTHTHTAGAITP